jgi:hypothetical protein
MIYRLELAVVSDDERGTFGGCASSPSASQRGGAVDTLLADYGLYHLEADPRWIEHAAVRLDLLARAVRHATRSSWRGGAVKSFRQTRALQGATIAVGGGRDTVGTLTRAKP